MTPCRFLLSVPLRACGTEQPSAPLVASRVNEIFASGPRIWIEGQARALSPGFCVIGPVFGPVASAAFRQGLSPDDFARWLVDSCWGAFCAILTDPDSGEICALPDPSGLMPIYRYESGQHAFLTNDIALLAAAGLANPMPDWSNIDIYLRWPELRRASTCLAGIVELVPGDLVDVSNGVTRARLWQPQRFLPKGAGPSFEDAIKQLRETAIMVLSEWSGHFGRAVVAASGGVDSSLICAALSNGGRGFACATLATADPSGDERRFAERLASHLGVPVRSKIYDLAAVDLLRPASRSLPRPQRKTFMQSIDRALAEVGHELNAAVVFDGNGGDNLFCFMHSAAPVVDSLRVRGLGAETLATLFDMCRLTGAGAGTMSRAVVRRLWQCGDGASWQADNRLLDGDGPAPSECTALRDWMGVQAGRHSGKRDHLDLILRCQNHLHYLPVQDDQRRFSPLMSQPLLELCLSLPTWLWCRGGLNRAVARSAFARDLPAEIAVRTSKAGPDSFIRTIFSSKRAQLRELLLDGLLTKHGLVDRRATEKALETDPMSGGSLIYRLLDLAEAEAWARDWSR